MKKFHIISHTHWDREWYQTYQQFRLKLVRLVDKLLDILDRDPDFLHFMLDGQTIILDDYLAVRPENKERLKRYIKEGRIIIGPWHILPDMFLVSPEAHIRNLLQGERTARKFGPKMSVGYIPDPFGHPGQIPQILKGFGLNSAALWRGVGDQPAELVWEAPDGSSVFLAYLRDGYGNGANLPVRNPDLFTKQLYQAGESLLAHSEIDECLIMLGTDHMEPPNATAASIKHADQHLADVQVLHSTLPAYFNNASEKLGNLREKLPVIQGELRACDRSHLLPGILSTRMWIKQRNQHSQILLEKWAEPFVIFTEALTAYEVHDYKSARATASRWLKNFPPLLRHAWRMLMENHPHDSICGCSIDQVHEEMSLRFDQAEQIGEELTLQALQRLSGTINTKKDGVISAIVIFNPHGTSHRDLVEVELDLPEDVHRFELIDGEGKTIPHEFIEISHEELANLLVDKKGLRDTIGGAEDGWVSGMAIQQVRISRKDPTVKIEAILDDEGLPNLQQWKKAEKMIARFESDPAIKQFHILAHTPRSSKIRFVSPGVSAHGWKTLWVRALPEKQIAPPRAVHPLIKPLLPYVLKIVQTEMGGKILAKLAGPKASKPPYVIENEFVRVEADPKDGTLQVEDKETRAVFHGLNRFVDGGDAGDTYNYSPPENDTLVTPQLDSIRVDPNSLIPTIEVKYSITVPQALSLDRRSRGKNKSKMHIISRITLIPGVRRIDIRTEVVNSARDHRLRVHFPVPFKVNQAHHDGHFEVVRRPVGVPEKGEDWVESPRPEVPQRAFTDISDGKIGLMVANRGLPEVEVLEGAEGVGSDIALTLLRCVGWLSRGDLTVRQGHAGPAYETPGAQMPGNWSFEYAIIPHRGDWRNAYHTAFAFQSNLRAIETELHTGQISEQGSFITHSPEEFVISAIKPAEKGEGWILRGYNVTDVMLEISIRPLINFSSAYRINLAEKIQNELNILDDGSIKISVSSHEIISVLFQRD
ncbi:MAG: alpha-mannosidase [Brevefilum sp.]